MKNIILKTAALGLLAFGMASCSDDLDIHSIDPQSSTSYDLNELLAKQYSTLGVTGQTGPSGKGDLSMDEGESGFFRTVFNLEDMCADEVAWAWQDNDDVPQLTNLSWTSASTRANWCWTRLAFDIQLFNQFINVEGANAGPQVTAEVRFLRALHYYYFLDLFHKAPFKLATDNSQPTELGGVDLYNWLDNELTNIEDTLPAIGTYNNTNDFGRADKGAALALHARLALNAEVYTDGQVNDYQKAIDKCNEIISSGKYALSNTDKVDPNGKTWSGYQQLFMGDNDYNTDAMKEIIFPIRQDGARTQCYSGSTFLISSAITSGMPYCNTNNYWQCYFARTSLVEKFFSDPSTMPQAKQADIDAVGKNPTEAQVIAYDAAHGFSTDTVVKKANDKRALLYMGVGGGTARKVSVKSYGGFFNGASVVKFTNCRSDGTARNNDTFQDTDIPLFRLAEIYLTRAEAEWRLGQTQNALNDINELRDRAGAARVTTATLNSQTIIDEWCKEFFYEGRRRSDLVRFGLFTSSDYVWPMKGGTSTGSGVDSHYNIYPVPAIELSNNLNIHQNPGY